MFNYSPLAICTYLIKYGLINIPIHTGIVHTKESINSGVLKLIINIVIKAF